MHATQKPSINIIIFRYDQSKCYVLISMLFPVSPFFGGVIVAAAAVGKKTPTEQKYSDFDFSKQLHCFTCSIFLFSFMFCWTTYNNHKWPLFRSDQLIKWKLNEKKKSSRRKLKFQPKQKNKTINIGFQLVGGVAVHTGRVVQYGNDYYRLGVNIGK